MTGALIVGALAYDTLMQFEGRFGEQLLPDELDRLSVSFPVPTLRREFGGCAGNIAFNLSLLGARGSPVCAVGHDFGPYRAWLDDCGVDRAYVQNVPDAFTAQAFITSDLDGNQITAFHPGAMASDAVAVLPDRPDGRLGVVAPDGAAPMARAAMYFADRDVPFLFDPGQFMTSLDADQMAFFVRTADWVAVNAYEAGLLCRGLGQSAADLSRQVRALIITDGARGSTLWRGGHSLHVPAVADARAVDPTGCGDAFRAGLVFGLLTEASWPDSVRLASVLGALAVEYHGTQNHRAGLEELGRRFERAYEHNWVW
ncbi:MAG: carbohydrate kinase family protein [Pseudomonadota bacterium]